MNLVGISAILIVVSLGSVIAKELSSCSCGLNKVNTRVINGREAISNNYPWMVALVDRNMHVFCGGSILNSQYILTAAHCLVNTRSPSEVWIAPGAHDKRDIKYTLRVSSIQIHRDYSGTQDRSRFCYNDVAIIKLLHPIDFSGEYGRDVKPICLPPNWMKTYPLGLHATGWGQTSDGGPQADKLQIVEFKEADHNRCLRQYGPGSVIKSTLCVEAPGKDVCRGDSGGPLVYKYGSFNFVVGVASFAACGKGTRKFSTYVLHS